MDLEEKTIERNTVFRGAVIRLRRDRASLPNGRECVREVVEFPGGVCVVPVTDDGQVLLVRQFRYPFGCVTLEAPAGKLNGNEPPLDCGIRELREETGAQAARFTDLGMMMTCPGYTDERIFMFLATGLTYGSQHPDEDEFLELVKMPLETAVENVLSGKITDGKTQTAILKAYFSIKK